MNIVLPLIHLDDIVFTPLPQLRLKNALVAAGHNPDDITVVEYRRDDSIQAMLDDIIRMNPDVVGFSCYTWNFLTVERLSEALKAVRPGTQIIWGGPHISELPERFMKRYPQVDKVITWYGEGAFPLVVNGTGLDMGGVWSRNGENVVGRQSTTYPHINTLGYPYQHLPQSVKANIADRVFLIESYRNCPFSCSYCLWGQAQKSYEALSSAEMVAQMYHMIDDGARIFMYADAGLGLIREGNAQRDLIAYRQFAADERLRSVGAQIRGYFFWQTLNDDVLDVIAELIQQGVMGQLDIGIQTFNPAVLEDLQRPTNYDRFFATVERLHQRDIRFSLDLILGLPGDTLEGFKRSLRSVIKCRPNRTQSFPLSILPGTNYDLKRDDFGIKTVRGSYRDDAETVIATNSFPYQDIQAALELESWMFLYYAEGLFSSGLNALAEEQDRDELEVLESLRDWCKEQGPYMLDLVNIYRSKLYDSRSDGRHQLEAQLMDTFPHVFEEIMLWAHSEDASQAAIDVFRDTLLEFPKTKQAAEGLQDVDDTLVYLGGRLYDNGKTYVWQQDPVIGAIVRNRNFYIWTKE